MRTACLGRGVSVSICHLPGNSCPGDRLKPGLCKHESARFCIQPHKGTPEPDNPPPVYGVWWCSFIRCHFCQRGGGIFGRSPALSLTSDRELLGTWLALRKVLLEIYLECLKIKTRASFTVSDLLSCQCWWTLGLWSQPPLKSGRRLTDHPVTGLEKLMAETINGLGVARAIAICQQWGTCCPVLSCL